MNLADSEVSLFAVNVVIVDKSVSLIVSNVLQVNVYDLCVHTTNYFDTASCLCVPL